LATTPDSAARQLEGRFFLILVQIWGDVRTRRFLVFFAVATLAAWLQDAILEPFGADLFGLIAEETTDFSRIWLGMTAVTLIGSNVLLRRLPAQRQGSIARIGLALMAVGMAVLASASFASQLRLVQMGLALFGAGFGVYSFGGFNLMAIMTTMTEAGAYLGMWTVTELVFKGVGTFIGGAMRDVLLQLSGSASTTYGLVFSLEAIGLVTAIVVLARVDVPGWIQENRRQGYALSDPTPVAVDAS
jgi:BCD family chlorophyll transporter-like MFS transporter